MATEQKIYDLSEILKLIEDAKRLGVDAEGNAVWGTPKEVYTQPLFLNRFTDDENTISSWHDITYPRNNLYYVKFKDMPLYLLDEYINDERHLYKNKQRLNKNEIDPETWLVFDSSGHRITVEEDEYLRKKYGEDYLDKYGKVLKDNPQWFFDYRDPRDIYAEDNNIIPYKNGIIYNTFDLYNDQLENANWEPWQPNLDDSSNSQLEERRIIDNMFKPLRPLVIQFADNVEGGIQNMYPTHTGKSKLVAGVNMIPNSHLPDLNLLNLPQFDYEDYSSSLIPNILIPGQNNLNRLNINYKDYDWSDVDEDEEIYLGKRKSNDFYKYLLPYLFSDLREKPFTRSKEDGIKIRMSADGGLLNIFRKGGKTENSKKEVSFNSIEDMIKAHEGFSSTPYKDGKNKKTGEQWYSIGYGFNDSGIHPNIAKNHFNKKMTRDEADILLKDYIASLQKTLKKTLGDKIYSTLTPGLMMAYIDTGYLRPVAMVDAAKLHKKTGDLNSVANALVVKGFDERNLHRRNAFFSNNSLSLLLDTPTNLNITQPNQIVETLEYVPNMSELVIKQPEGFAKPASTLKLAIMMAEPNLYTTELAGVDLMKELFLPLGIKYTNKKEDNSEEHDYKIKLSFDEGGLVNIDRDAVMSDYDIWAKHMSNGNNIPLYMFYDDQYMYDIFKYDKNEAYNMLSSQGKHPKLKEWKALNNIDYIAIPDPNFTRDKTGAGDIEYFDSKHPKGITYNNGYHRDHPIPGKDVILYNPNTNDEQDIRLDALHIMPKDPTYDTLNQLYREAAKGGDPGYQGRMLYEEDARKYGKNNIDSEEQYFNNEADGLLRNMFIEGSPEYIENKRYRADKDNLIKENEYLMPYIKNILRYLESGLRPKWILTRDDNGNILDSKLLDETIVPANTKSNGGPVNMFLKAGKINIANKYRRRILDPTLYVAQGDVTNRVNINRKELKAKNENTKKVIKETAKRTAQYNSILNRDNKIQATLRLKQAESNPEGYIALQLKNADSYKNMVLIGPDYSTQYDRNVNYQQAPMFYLLWLRQQEINRGNEFLDATILRPLRTISPSYLLGAIRRTIDGDNYIDALYGDNNTGITSAFGPQGESFALNYPFTTFAANFITDWAATKGIGAISKAGSLGKFSNANRLNSLKYINNGEPKGFPLLGGRRWYSYKQFQNNPNWYYRVGNDLAKFALEQGTITGKMSEAPFFSKGEALTSRGINKDILVHKGNGNYNWANLDVEGNVTLNPRTWVDDITGLTRMWNDVTNKPVGPTEVTPLVNGKAGIANPADFTIFKPFNIFGKNLGYVEKPLTPSIKDIKGIKNNTSNTTINFPHKEKVVFKNNDGSVVVKDIPLDTKIDKQIEAVANKLYNSGNIGDEVAISGHPGTMLLLEVPEYITDRARQQLIDRIKYLNSDNFDEAESIINGNNKAVLLNKKLADVYDKYGFNGTLTDGFTWNSDGLMTPIVLRGPNPKFSTFLHELRHKLESAIKLDQTQLYFLDKGYYGIEKGERATVNTELRNKLLPKEMLLKTINLQNEYIKNIPNHKIVTELYDLNSYGHDYISNILDTYRYNIKNIPKDIFQNIINSMMFVPLIEPDPAFVNILNNTNN